MASRKLRPYFQAHPITVLTDQPLRQVLQKPEAAGRLLKWIVELGYFDISYFPRAAIKGQALADFIAKFTELTDGEQNKELEKPESQNQPPSWKLFTDGSSNEHHAGAGVILITPEGHQFHCAIRFDFTASNNEAEYEALLARLRLAMDMNIKVLDIYSVSQLVVNQVTGEYQAQGLKMVASLNKTKDLLAKFDKYTLKQVPRDQNSNADALAKLACAKDADTLNIVLVE